MNKIKKFLNSLYLGDRFCEKMEISNNKIILQINCISRLKDNNAEWKYYTDQDIEHGCIVFDEVVDYCFNSDLPFNDEIYEIQVVNKKDKVYSFVIYGCNISDEAVSTDIELRVYAKKIYIINPQDNSIITE